MWTAAGAEPMSASRMEILVGNISFLSWPETYLHRNLFRQNECPRESLVISESTWKICADSFLYGMSSSSLRLIWAISSCISSTRCSNDLIRSQSWLEIPSPVVV